MISRQCLLLDLKDDPALIARYEANHREVWPEVLAHLRQHGVVTLEIYRHGTRLCMVLEVDDSRFDAERMAAAERSDPRIREWEALMWQFQAPLPGAEPGQKWLRAERIFELAGSSDGPWRPVAVPGGA